MHKGISVIICCYNSEKVLSKTLACLSKQIVSSNIFWEIIVVDNASRDNTALIAQQIWDGLDTQNIYFKVIRENQAGLQFAKELGIKHSKFEYILFCDDDNRLNPHYIQKAFNVMETDDSIGVLGGNGNAVTEVPTTISKADIEQLTASGPQTLAGEHHWVYGAGSVYRKSIFLRLLNELEWQPITTGRKGKNLSSGEDVETCFMIYLLGYQVIADDSLTFDHLVSESKLNDEFKIRMAYGLSYSYYLLQGYIKLIFKNNDSLNLISVKLLYVHCLGFFDKKINLFIKNLKGLKGSIEERVEIEKHKGMILSILHNHSKLNKHYKNISSILLKNKQKYV